MQWISAGVLGAGEIETKGRNADDPPCVEKCLEAKLGGPHELDSPRSEICHVFSYVVLLIIITTSIFKAWIHY